MSLLNFCARIFVDWCVVSYIVVGAYIVAMARMKRRRSRPDDTRPAQYPPPLPAPITPPFTQTIPDASWFDGLPVEILSDDAVHSLFDRLVEIDLPELKGLDQ